MYESHFGLKSRPFSSKAEGTAVFVGPGQAETINGLHKGLLAQDAVVTVIGPAGTGKTTIVNRALETMSPGRVAAWVGRMKISSEEILELLLAGFGFSRKSNSTLQRFVAFRRFMNERAAGGVQVAIVVEDARKLGVEALAEIEALTASDTADGGGANIVLMGDEGFNDLLADPELARLRQRIRRRIRVAPLNEAEVGGYLKHAIRQAGGQYDTVFDDGVAGIVCACSEGMPRIINALCESALTAAAEDGDRRVTAARMHTIAADVYGYEGPAPAAAAAEEMPEVTAEESASEAAAVPAARHDSFVGIPSISIPGIDDADIPESARNLVVESGRYPLEPDLAEEDIDEQQDAAKAAAEPEAEAKPPAEAGPAAEPEPVAEPTAIAEPEPAAEPRPQTEAPAGASLTSSELREPAACDIVDDEPTLTDIPELINDTQPQLEALSNAVDELLATNSRDQSHRDEPAQANGGADDDESFDLDAALSPDVESTNMMPGITTNLDDIVAAGDAAGRNSPDAAALADLPTLSDSMRVDVKKAARQAADAVEEPVATSATVPAIEPEPAADATADSAPVAAAEDEHPENPEGDSELALEPAVTQDGSPHAESVDNALDDTSGAELEPEPALEFDPDFALENLPADEPEPAVALAVETDDTGGGEDEVAALSVDTDDAPVMPEPTGHEPDLASDLDALEAALQSAKQGELAVAPQPAINGAAPVDVAPDATPEAAPEITLDRALEEQQVQSRKLADVSSAIGGVNSLEDIDDLTAETLFGEEFAAIADSVVAEGQLVDPNAADAPEAEPAATEAVTADACNDDAADAAPSSGANTATANGSSGESELRQSVAMRIDVLNEMKAKIATEHTEVVELGEEPARSPHRGPQPEPIERQINTSMTQTLQALKVSQAADAVADARSKKKSGGLFARFRRSS